jgi:hypothetical protein
LASVTDRSFANLQKKTKNMDAKITTAINLTAMGAGIAAAVAATNKSKAASAEASKIEKSISELSAKFDKMVEQLKIMWQQAPQQQQQKPQDVIYVRKSSEFSFYN